MGDGVFRYALLLSFFTACGGGYDPGAFATSTLYGGQQFPGTRLQHGCLDIALRARATPQDPTLDISLGNRCVDARWVDLSRLEIRGVFSRGESRTLRLFDPREEIGPALLGGRAAAKERIEVVGGLGATQLCISVEDVVEMDQVGPRQETCIDVEVLQS